MQMQIFRRVGLGLMALGLTLSVFAILSCGSSDDDGSSDGTERNAALSGANERNAAGAVPAATANSPGSGTAVLTVSDDQTQITYVLTYSGLTNVQQAHIHVGTANDSGPIILFLCTNVGTSFPSNVAIGGGQLPAPPPCPSGSGSVAGTLTAANLIPRPPTPVVTGVTPAINNFADAVTQVVNGGTYTNVHTATNPGGEIRGQDL
jgi:hypothetical protein